MKEFVVKNLAKFLATSDQIETPFKFLQIDEAKTSEGTVLYELKASVWMRTAFLTYEDIGKDEYFENVKNVLLKHDFMLAEIREAPITLR